MFFDLFDAFLFPHFILFRSHFVCVFVCMAHSCPDRMCLSGARNAALRHIRRCCQCIFEPKLFQSDLY